MILTKGLPASGKTTWAKEKQDQYPGLFKRINKDDLRSMLDNGKWSASNEKFILQTRDALILSALEAGKNVIVDDTNLHEKHQNHIKELVKGKAIVEIQDFTSTPLEECIKRDLQRPHSVGEKVIRDMWKQYLKPTVEQYVPNKSLPEAIIVDVDGTLAKMVARGPFEMEKLDTDQPKDNVVEFVRRMEGYKIIIVTGRSEPFADATKLWLARHCIPFHAFFCRKEGDNRSDSIVKKEIFDEITKTFQVKFVLDDRNRVVEMWRDNGVECWQVAEGDF